MNGLRINVGCGASPTPGWLNFDSSLTVRLAGLPLSKVIAKAGMVPHAQRPFFEKAVEAEIRWANAVRRIPIADGAAAVVYSSHMLEHLDHPRETTSFLREALRVLAPSGKLRIVVPDLRKLVDQYVATGNADALVGDSFLAQPKLHSWRERLQFLLIGYRGHAWMYDEASLCALLKDTGFARPRGLPPGQTTIDDPGSLNLRERDHESVYVEAEKPPSAPTVF